MSSSRGKDNSDRKKVRRSDSKSSNYKYGKDKKPYIKGKTNSKWSHFQDVPVIQLNNPQSFLDCKDKFMEYLEAEYGKLGRFVKENEYLELPPLDLTDMDNQGYSELNKKTAVAGRISDREKLRNEFINAKSNIYGGIMTMLTESGKVAVRSHSDHQAAILFQSSCNLILTLISITVRSNYDKGEYFK